MKNNKVIEERLGDKPPKAISKVRHYILEKYGLLLTLEQVSVVFNEPSAYWVAIDYIDTLESNTVDIRLDGYIHHFLWARLTGTLASTTFDAECKMTMLAITEQMNWEDGLHSYSDLVLSLYKGERSL